MNPIISQVRTTWDSGDAHAHASEALFQLARLWTEHQSPATGTFPLPWRDTPRGVLSPFEAVETGEDYLYWEMVLALTFDQPTLPFLDQGAEGFRAMLKDWHAGNPPEGYNPDRAMRHIMVATHALHRIHRMTEETA